MLYIFIFVQTIQSQIGPSHRSKRSRHPAHGCMLDDLSMAAFRNPDAPSCDSFKGSKFHILDFDKLCTSRIR